MDLAAANIDLKLEKDHIAGGIEDLNVDNDEDMLVAICYIAECLTFNKPIDMDTFNVEVERLRILDTFLSLLAFE